MAYRNNFFNVPGKIINRLILHVHFLRLIVFALFFTGMYLNLSAQDEEPRRRGSRIIDDTTKQVYGPKTSKYYFEKDVFFNRITYHPIDTAIRNFHRYNYIQRHNNLYQDLGNIGTAIRPIFYQVPDIIGVTSGFDAYNLYWDDEQIRYFDTKSPYSNIRATLGGKGRSMTRVTFSRNITPQWNFGFNYRALLIDKQIQRQGKGDRNVRGTYYDIYTSYQSPDSAYRVMFNYRRNNHESDEYGGIVDNADEFEYKDYFFINAQPFLQDAASRELRMNAHLYHQYEIGKALQLYHTFDRYRQGNQFLDGPSDNEYYDYFDRQMDTTKTWDKVKFKYVRNEVGIKGNLLKLFYNGYYAIRDYTFTNNHIDTTGTQISGVESYIGGRMSLHLDSIGEITGWVEVQQEGNFRIDGQIKSKWFEGSIKQVQYAPSLLQQGYRGSHDSWTNAFSNVNATEINGYLHYNSKILKVSPGLSFTRLGNYIFFKEDAISDGQRVLPIQSSGQQVIVSPELKFSFTFMRHINLSSQIIYSKVLDNPDNAIQLPDLFINAQLSYENIFFNGNLDMHAGVDVHYKSSYYPLAYDVPIQQFYVQQQITGEAIKVPEFPIVDIFFSARIKRGRIFFKYHNLMQAFTKQGYMLTPGYPGQRNIIDFGFDWSFYD
ncbi:putative porin [Chryseolinea sp. H1M3-3]|uniref:putative porin n=1 Tax=Chryseolinea sp. H1M3-3 TaxID=3034144 RepID=UPI0023EE19A2|nr:putative porin [Chryseolinea sp. H1M3-3]